MSAEIERPPDTLTALAAVSDGPNAFEPELLTLADLPVGARLILQCRRDWRDAAVVAVSMEMVTLRVGSPSGHTYKVRRPSDSVLSVDGSVPVLGEGHWRVGRVRYDVRW